MPCRNPLAAYPTPTGGLTFESAKAAGYRSMSRIRCGVCRDCRLHSAREWAIRCVHEAQMHERNCFVTLTFETDPASIAKRDLQVFFKRLRNRGLKFSYYACGEYGEKFARPHYHVCLFGIDFGEDRYPWKRTPKGSLLYRSPLLETCWKYGHAYIGELTQESAGYTARYCMKKITGDLADQHYQREFMGHIISVTPEFAMMSKHPPIGLRWLQKYWRDVFPADNVIYNGKECPVPRYYFKWLEANEPAMAKIVQAKRKDYYSEQENETGLRMLQAAQSRDGRYKKLIRNYEDDS